MRRYKFLLLALLLTGGVALAQGPTYKLGTTPTETEIMAMDTLVDQDGRDLPQGQGTATQGAPMYAQRCAMCHGPNGEGTDTPAGVGPFTVRTMCNSNKLIDLTGATCAITAIGVLAGVSIFRVHDTRGNRQTANVTYKLNKFDYSKE